MMKRKFAVLIIVSMFLFTVVSTSAVIGEDNNSEPIQKTDNTEMKKWTFMLYDDADFKASWYDPGIFDITREAPICKNVNIVVLQDTVYGPAKMWYVGPLGFKRTIKRMGEVNMGDYQTLKNFLEYCKQNFPAERYMLDIFNHGGGWGGACSDITNNDWLTMDEMKKALIETGGVDIITFIAPCLMGAVESVYELRNCVDVYMGSEAGNGYDFRVLRPMFKLLNNENDLSNIEIGDKLIEIRKEVESRPSDFLFITDTMSAMRTDTIEDLIYSIDNLSLYLNENLDDLKDEIDDALNNTQSFFTSIDLSDFAQKFIKIEGLDQILYEYLYDIVEKVDSTVINEYHSNYYPDSYGLTIFFPLCYTGLKSDISEYQNVDLDFSNDTHWDEFLIAFDELYFTEVNYDGTADFTTIQAAVDNASEGDAIYVYNGIYNENIVINKSIILIGEWNYQNITIINGDNSGDVVTITADGVILSHFLIQNSGDEDAGVKICSNSVQVISNLFRYNNIGVYLNASSYDVIFFNFIEKNSRYGVFLDSSHHTSIIYNMFSNNGRDTSFLNSYKNSWGNSYLDHPKRRINLIFGKKTIGGFSIPQINIDRLR